MSEIPAFAPGCFGSALAYTADHSICRACVFRDRCEPVHQANLAALRAQLGVEVKETVKPAKTTPAVDPGAMTVPKKVLELIQKLDQGNFRVVEHLQRGENPFKEGMTPLRYACQILLHLNRPLTRKDLGDALMRNAKWTDYGTAHAQARIALQALAHIGAVDEFEGSFVLRKDL